MYFTIQVEWSVLDDYGANYTFEYNQYLKINIVVNEKFRFVCNIPESDYQT